jgi:hypothetical protein
MTVVTIQTHTLKGDSRTHPETGQSGVNLTLSVITRGGAEFCGHKASTRPLPVPASYDVPVSVDSWSMTFRKRRVLPAEST